LLKPDNLQLRLLLLFQQQNLLVIYTSATIGAKQTFETFNQQQGKT